MADAVLKITQQPPAAVLMNEVFEIGIQIEGSEETFHVNASADGVSAQTSQVKRTGTIKCCLTQERDPNFFIQVVASSTSLSLSTVTSEVNIAQWKVLVSPINWEPIWYKDEGGRDKSMTVLVGVYNRSRELLRQKVDLTMTLCYATRQGPIPISNQNILRVLCMQVIEDSSGTARIRFRVEDVSKNHQGQDFCFMVSVRSNPQIASGVTPPVTVRSKRNKRNRSVVADQTLKRPKIDSDQRIQEALREVTNWASTVVRGLYPLQWQIVGYSQDPDGKPDYNRPINNMTNPNIVISKVLKLYNESVVGNLQVLREAIEKPGKPTAPPHPLRSTDVPFTVSYPKPMRAPLPMLPRATRPPCTTPPCAIFSSLPNVKEVDDRVEYVLAKHFQSLSNETLGFPAFAASGDLLGFYAYLNDAFEIRYGGPVEKREASALLDQGGDAVLSRQEYGSLTELLSEAMSREQGTSTSCDDEVMGVDDSSEEDYDNDDDDESQQVDNHETEIEYLVARKFNSKRTGELLGFPVYSNSKELLGFYQNTNRTLKFCNVPDEFGAVEKERATKILESAGDAVQTKEEAGSISNMVNQALVYEFRMHVEGKEKLMLSERSESQCNRANL